MKGIPLSNTFKEIKEIKKGMSGDKKYFVTAGGNKRYLLRISDIKEFETKKGEYELMQKLSSSGIPMPQPVDFGVCDDCTNVYTLLSWVEGEEAERVIPKLSESEQYSFGKESGRILSLIHSLMPLENTESWSERYFKVIDERLKAFCDEGERFFGWDVTLGFIENNRHLLDGRPQTYHHGDYHMGNLIINDKKVSVIDWHTVDFGNIGDPWYEFNRIGAEYPYFAAGQIDGYFGSNVPGEFWMLLCYYLSVSALTSIVWAKYFAPERCPEIIILNKKILEWYDNMKTAVPKWYVKNM